ncbi:MAG: PadR family transcriptional regulator [Thaumarchaeota archaeon]|nr:PadR family transcriptional regulator [Candidatus Calditenuaceae archaeon]MDW8041911.1 PadR family transcriptional regulator [Nitrososphaerota archaeon]
MSPVLDGPRTRASKRLVRKLTLENLWLYVLALLRERPRYGYEFLDLIKERFGFSPSRVTCYVVLYRLEREGLIRSIGVERSRSGGARVYYELTEMGRRELDFAIKFLKGVSDKLVEHERSGTAGRD